MAELSIGNVSWMDMALVGCVVISWMAVLMSLYCMKRLRRQADLTQRLYQRLNHDLELTNSGSIGMGQRLIALERKLVEARKANNRTAITEDKAFEPYSLAAQMMSAGIDEAEVARRCGISRAEASLMQMMHTQVKSAA